MLEQLGQAPVRIGSCGRSLREGFSESFADSVMGTGVPFIVLPPLSHESWINQSTRNITLLRRHGPIAIPLPPYSQMTPLPNRQSMAG